MDLRRIEDDGVKYTITRGTGVIGYHIPEAFLGEI